VICNEAEIAQRGSLAILQTKGRARPKKKKK
jgi:hypothetical protein